MNDISVKLVESPKGLTCDDKAPSTEECNDAEVDPLAIVSDEVKDTASTLVVLAVDDTTTVHDTSVDHCDGYAKENNDGNIIIQNSVDLPKENSEEILQETTNTIDSTTNESTNDKEDNLMTPIEHSEDNELNYLSDKDNTNEANEPKEIFSEAVLLEESQPEEEQLMAEEKVDQTVLSNLAAKTCESEKPDISKELNIVSTEATDIPKVVEEAKSNALGLPKDIIVETKIDTESIDQTIPESNDVGALNSEVQYKVANEHTPKNTLEPTKPLILGEIKPQNCVVLKSLITEDIKPQHIEVVKPQSLGLANRQSTEVSKPQIIEVAKHQIAEVDKSQIPIVSSKIESVAKITDLVVQKDKVPDIEKLKELIKPQIDIKETTTTVLDTVLESSKYKINPAITEILPVSALLNKLNEDIEMVAVNEIDKSEDFPAAKKMFQDPKIKVRNFDLEMNTDSSKVEVKAESAVENARSSNPVNGDLLKDDQPLKRRASEDIETESPLKRLCQEVEKTFPQHDSMINDYIQTASKNNVDEIQRHTEQLLSEIQTLRELAQKKEHEWNNILHLKKVKEEILLRLLRKKQVISFEKSPEINGSGCKDPFDYLNQSKNLAIDKSDEISGLSLKPPSSTINPNPMMQQPVMSVASHFNPMAGLPPPYDKVAHMQGMPKPVYPQSLMMPGPTMPGPSMPFPRDLNGQMPGYGLPMGRQGPTKDVKSIIADYRQRNPDLTPRRGRRMKSLINPNMMNTPRPIAPKVDNLSNLGMIFNNLDMSQKAMLERLTQMQAGNLPNGLSFKDVLVQFANIQQQNSGLMPPRPDMMLHRPESSMRQEQMRQESLRSEQMRHESMRQECMRQEPIRQEIRPETIRPEPQPRPDSRRRVEKVHEEIHGSVKQNERVASSSPRLPPPPYPEISLLPVSMNNQDNQSQQNSLLHGILTKNCGEITITPVQPTPPPPENPPEKPDDVVQLDDEESPQSDNSGEDGESSRLVIDATADETPLCQGCRRRDAQFVCAGCANQWYCSRDCQVAAWDDHSEMCSG